MNRVESDLVALAQSIIADRDAIEQRIKDAHATLAEAKKLATVASDHRDNIDKIIAQKTICFPWLAHAVSDYYALCDESLARSLSIQRNRAPKSAQLVKEASKRRREAEYLYRQARYKIQYYESLFPWLSDFIDEDLEDDLIDTSIEAYGKDVDDADRRWLSAAEYANLSDVDRSQRALDRYWKAKKSKWQIGRDYERYIGYLYEYDGYRVEYKGIFDGMDDLGRDLILTKGSHTLIVQCKCWSRHKKIHEKHVFQLYGSMIEYSIDHGIGDREVTATESDASLFDVVERSRLRGVLAVSNSLSDRARVFADKLGIEVREDLSFDNSYPCIKCNVSATGERIFHLPFDQQYDRVVIEPHKGEFYATTVEQASQAGFRRAKKHLGPR